MENNKSKFKYGLIGLLFLGWILGGFDRTVINFAAISITKEFGMTATQTGLIISAFFAGYMLMQIPGGMLADKFGSRRVLLVIVFVWSIFTGLTGVVTSMTAMLVVRFMFGIGEGPYTPSAGKLIAVSFEEKERAKATSLMLSSSGVVAILAPVLSAYLLTAVGWRNLFFMIGAAGACIVVLFYLFLKEGTYSASGTNKGKPAQDKVSYRTIFKIPMIRNLLIANFACYTLMWGLSSWMPTYLMGNFNIDLKATGWLQSIPGLGSFLSILASGFIIDRMTEKQNKNIVTTIAIVCSFALFVLYRGGLSIAAIIAIETIISLSTGYIAIYMPVMVYKKMPVSIVGSTSGTTNFAAQLGSFFAPFVMGIIADANGGNIGASFWYLFAMGMILTIAIATMKSSIQEFIHTGKKNQMKSGELENEAI